MIVRALSLVMAAWLASAWSEPAHAQRSANYCAISGADASLMLIDRTSPYTTSGEDRQGQRIAAGVDAVLAGLGAGDRITIATIERHRRLSVIAFDGCYPGCDESRRGGVLFFDNCPRATIDSERQSFRRRLYRAIMPLLQNDQDQPHSDITGTISQMSAHSRFARIYIYSDMLENSQALPWPSFSTASAADNLRAVQRSGFVPTLRNAQVQVVGFGLSHARDRPPLTDQQDRTIREFWRMYFDASGASISYRTTIDAGGS